MVRKKSGAGCKIHVIISIRNTFCWLAVTPLEIFLCFRKHSYRTPLGPVYLPLSLRHPPASLLNTPERQFRWQPSISVYGTYFPQPPLIGSKCKISFTSLQTRWSREFRGWIWLEITTHTGVQRCICLYFDFWICCLYWEGSNSRLQKLSKTFPPIAPSAARWHLRAQKGMLKLLVLKHWNRNPVEIKISTMLTSYQTQYHDSICSKWPKKDCDSFISALLNFLRYWFCNLNSFKCVCTQVESEFCMVSYNKKKFECIQQVF